jgi:polysaccharide export outer membrane protein
LRSSRDRVEDVFARRRWARTLLIVLALGLFSGCGGSGRYTWYTALPRSDWSQPAEYTINPGDVLSITVYEQPNLSSKGKIRRDGRIEIPFVGELHVAGKKPFDVAREVEERLKRFIVSPRVTVNIEESQPVSVTVLGEVTTKGTVALQPPADLAQALAQAGGLTEFADESKIFVLRRQPVFRRIRFTYDAIVENEAGAAMFPLQNGDVVIVE